MKCLPIVSNFRFSFFFQRQKAIEVNTNRRRLKWKWCEHQLTLFEYIFLMLLFSSCRQTGTELHRKVFTMCLCLQSSSKHITAKRITAPETCLGTFYDIHRRSNNKRSETNSSREEKKRETRCAFSLFFTVHVCCCCHRRSRRWLCVIFLFGRRTVLFRFDVLIASCFYVHFPRQLVFLTVDFFDRRHSKK